MDGCVAWEGTGRGENVSRKDGERERDGEERLYFWLVRGAVVVKEGRMDDG